MSDSSEFSLRHLAEELGKASTVLGKADVGNVMKLCEIIKLHLKRKAARLVAGASGRPILSSYSCDSTPMKSSVRLSAGGLVPNEPIERRGKHCVEFLLQRGWYKTLGPDGGIKMTPLLGDPVPLTLGKTAWHLYSAAQDFTPLLQEMGHDGISISHYAFDRAIYAPLLRKLLQRHGLQQARQEATQQAQPVVPRHLLNWVVGTGCAMHDAQNGFKWALAPYVQSTDIVRDLHITIESLRNSIYTLSSHLRGFFSQAVAFDKEPYNRDEVYEFWVALGVGPDVADVMAELNPWFSSGHLWIAGQWEGHEQLEETLSRMLMYLLRLKRFTESRWCTAGPSCRALVGCLAVGLEELVAASKKDPHSSDFYINGFSRLSPSVKMYAVRASLVAYVPDSFLQQLMEDDRVGKRFPTFEKTMVEELAWLEGLSPTTWKRLAQVAGPAACPQKLRSEVLLGGQVAASFITNRVLNIARGFPWCLVRGDVEQKLSDLSSLSSPPSDHTAGKIYQLISTGHQGFYALFSVNCVENSFRLLIRKLGRLEHGPCPFLREKNYSTLFDDTTGYNTQLLKDALLLLGEVSWTTCGVEQGHGSVAVVHRLHPDYSVPMLAARSLAHQARALFATPSQAGPLEKAEAKLGKLQKRSPEKICGRQIFLADAFAALKTELAKSGQTLTNEMRLRVMREHGSTYKNLPLQKRRRYEDLAQNVALERRSSLDEEIAHSEAELGMTRRRALEERLASGTQQCLLANARFSDADVDAMVSCWGSEDFAMGTVMGLRKSAVAPPPTPTLAEQAALNSQPTPSLSDSLDSPTPDWVRKVCAHRNEFQGCVLVGVVNGLSKAFSILYAMQKPLLVALSPLLPAQRVMPPFRTMPIAEQRAWLENHFANEFRVQLGVSQLHDTVVFDEGEDLEVITQAKYLPGLRLCSHLDPTPLEDFCASLPKAAAKKAASSSTEAADPTLDPDMLKMYPWLEKYAKHEPGGGSEASPPTAGVQTNMPETPELDEELVQKVWALLEERRQEWAEEDVVHTTDFETFIRGGAWVQSHTGSAYDCIIGRPCTEPARAWIQQFFPTKTAAFAYKKYGEQAANMLALAWCHRMQYLFDLYADSNRDPFVYTEAELQAYVPEPAYTEWVRPLPADAPAKVRHDELMANNPHPQPANRSKASSSSV